MYTQAYSDEGSQSARGPLGWWMLLHHQHPYDRVMLYTGRQLAGSPLPMVHKANGCEQRARSPSASRRRVAYSPTQRASPEAGQESSTGHCSTIPKSRSNTHDGTLWRSTATHQGLARTFTDPIDFRRGFRLRQVRRADLLLGIYDVMRLTDAEAG